MAGPSGNLLGTAQVEEDLSIREVGIVVQEDLAGTLAEPQRMQDSVWVPHQDSLAGVPGHLFPQAAAWACPAEVVLLVHQPQGQAQILPFEDPVGMLGQDLAARREQVDRSVRLAVAENSKLSEQAGSFPLL